MRTLGLGGAGAWRRACIVAIVLSCGACAHVHPYEREYHSKPHMTPGDERAETAFQAHLRESREGATSGSSAAGGGCGCN
ncbi:MAG TPA: DUF4266 domain-containing protein [Polyangiales bacterium]